MEALAGQWQEMGSLGGQQAGETYVWQAVWEGLCPRDLVAGHQRRRDLVAVDRPQAREC